MKQTVVPAQITTVEDRIVGSLGLTQIVLLALPVLATGLVFTAFPPAMHIAPYKIIALTVLAAICGMLAIRIRGQLMLFWLIVRVRFNIRPTYYIFNKNTTANRELYDAMKTVELPHEELEKTAPRRRASKLSVTDTIRAFEAMDNPAAHLTFATNKKGNLYVHITEVNSKI
ncbi:MAG TPA: hypothetical protein VLF69_03115 [Candidatus Saccharimonadales bacterium]|nr:hypothetical protein [Candidatus Saccharimonadales bacterium]